MPPPAVGRPGFLVVVSGLPASGKTTTGRQVAGELGVPLVDKDAVLEALFDTLGSPDRASRERLSRAADEVVFSLAGSLEAAVLVNWWHHETAPARLAATGKQLVEVFCDCPVQEAARRFVARTRHPGHHDPVRSPAELAADVERVRASYAGALGVGAQVPVSTSEPVVLPTLMGRIRQALGQIPASPRTNLAQ